MKKIFAAVSVVVLASGGICWAEDVKVDQLTPSQEVRQTVASGKKDIAPADRFRNKIAERQIKTPQIQSRAKEMKISTDMSTPNFVSRQREMKITDHGATQIKAPQVQTLNKVNFSSGKGERAMSNTALHNNMQMNYMGKILEGRVDYIVNTGEKN